MLSNVNFVSYSDNQAEMVYLTSNYRPTIKEVLGKLYNFTDMYGTDNCEYSKLRRDFKPVLAVIHPSVNGWTKGFEVRFFDKNMLDNHQIEEGFSSEPRGKFSNGKRSIFTIDGDKATLKKKCKI